MKVYLDLCTIQRPLNTPNQVRIVLESEAVLGVIALCHKGQVELISSEALLYEGEQNPLPLRREHTLAVLSEAKIVIIVTEMEKKRATNLMAFGIKPLDSLHLAAAETGGADFFCNCDDRLLRKAQEVNDLKVKVLNPIDLIWEMEE